LKHYRWNAARGCRSGTKDARSGGETFQSAPTEVVRCANNPVWASARAALGAMSTLLAAEATAASHMMKLLEKTLRRSNLQA